MASLMNYIFNFTTNILSHKYEIFSYIIPSSPQQILASYLLYKMNFSPLLVIFIVSFI